MAVVLVAYIGTVAAVNIPAVQRVLSRTLAGELSKFLGTEVEIGNVSPGFLNRLIADNLLLYDQQGRELLHVTRFSAKYSLWPMLHGRIQISTVQLFGFSLHATRDSAAAPLNFQFLIDKLSSDSNTQSDLDMRVNSLLLRRGHVTYDIADADTTQGRFNANHIDLRGIRGNVSLKALRNDSINASIRQLSFTEQNSGLQLASLSLKLAGGGRQALATDLELKLPQTTLTFDTIRATYDSIGALGNFADDVRLSVRILPSDITLSDLQAFVPTFSSFHDKMSLELAAEGTLNDLTCTQLDINGDHLHVQGTGSVRGLMSTPAPSIKAELKQAYTDSTGVAFLTRNLGGGSGQVPAAVRNMRYIDFHGQVEGKADSLRADGTLASDLGTVVANVDMDSRNGGGKLRGIVETQDFQIGRLIGNKDMGSITFSLDIDGHDMYARYPHMTVSGLVDSLQYRGYTYKDIDMDGEYKDGGFDGNIALYDENARITFSGNVNTAEPVNVFRFHGSVEGLRPSELRLSDKYQGCELSLRINADFTGNTIDNMIGSLSLDSMTYETPDRQYSLRQLALTAHKNDDGSKRLHIQSDFMQATLEGSYSYRTLYASIANVLGRYLPTYFPQAGKRTTDNDFSFNIDISNTDFMAALLQLPINVYSESTMKGFFSDRAGRMRVEGYFPRMSYNGRQIESGVIHCDNAGDRFQASLRFNNRRDNDALNIAATATARNDSIDATLNWGNNGQQTFSGQLNALVQFVNDEAQQQKTLIDIQPSDVILNDTLWSVQRSRITIENKRTTFDNMLMSSADHHLRIDGTLSAQPEDTLLVDMERMNIGYIFDMADLGVSFDGVATGQTIATGVLGEPYMLSNLYIEGFGYNNSIIGDADIIGEWHNQQKGLYLEADIKEADIAHSLVTGYIYPLKPTSSLDLHIDADSTNIGFVQTFLKNVTSDFRGRVSGHVDLYGKFNALTIAGDVMGDASIKMDALNTTYTLRDSVIARPEGLFFRNSTIYDERGTRGTLDGEVLWDHFHHVSYDLTVDANNLLVMNTQQNADYTFYGTVYATGNININGGDEGMNMDMALTTNRNTVFTYIKDGVTTAATDEFVRYIDRTPRRVSLDSIPETNDSGQQISLADSRTSDMRLNIIAEITPDAQIRIVMDPLTGDAIISRGTANLRIDWYNKGSLNIFGSYRISQGTYKMSVQEIIRKDFVIQDGSTMTFAGDPFAGTLDLHTKYQVNSVSLNDLIPNASSYIAQTSVRVDCLMDMSGSITSPQLSLGLELPLESDEIQALINNYIPTEEQMNMQILYLLSIGKFYTPEYVNVSQNSNVMSSVVSSTLSGQLNQALSAVINSDNWNFGTNLSTGQDGWTDMEFEGILSGTLLNNRLIVNGNFGYRDNQMSNTNFVGDFDAQLLLTPSGDIRLKAYNETNDKYFTRTNLTTQGIGIIFRKDFDSWNDLSFRRRLKLGRRKAEAADSTSVSTQPADTLTVQKADTLMTQKAEAQQKRDRNSFVTIREKEK